MKNNLIIDFDLDYDVKISLNNNLIGTSGYKDTFSYTIEEDGLLTFKHKTQKASIRVYKDKPNKIKVQYSTTGQLKATFLDDTLVNETSNENSSESKPKQEKTVDTNTIDKVNEPIENKPQYNQPQPNQNSNSGSIIGIIIVVAIVLFVMYLFGIGIFSSSDSSDGSSNDKDVNPETNARYQIQNLIRNAPSNYIYLYSYYTIGKITSVSCNSSENETDGNGRYFMKCSYTYNPKNGNGSTMLDREHNGGVYALYMDNGDGTFAYRFGRSAIGEKEKFKSDNCWGKSKSLKLNCKQ